jgi:hypothetical protein
LAFFLSEIVREKNNTGKNTIKKRTFLGLLLTALLFLLGVALYLLVFVCYPHALFTRSFVMGLTISAILLTLLFLCGLLAIVISILRKRTFLPLRWIMGKTLFFLYPIVLLIGRLTHITQEKIQRSFIEVNNQLVRSRGVKAKSDELLLLLPHCLQNDNCSYKITHNIDNCRRCGRCQIAQILELSSARGVPAVVATGGTLARRAVKKYTPRMVVAVACERDLSSGVLDSFPLPVLGVLNERPEGPCYNTRVDLRALQEALDLFLT